MRLVGSAVFALALACVHAGAPAPDPRRAAASVERGDGAMQRYRETRALDHVAAAEAAYRRALELDGGSADALAGLAWVHGVEHAFEESLALAERALVLNPEHRSAHGLLADAALELGRTELAARHVQAMLDLRPDLASYSRAARLLERRGRPVQAALLMRRAIAAGAPRAESTAWCRAELARMLWRRGALLPAERVVVEARRLAPEHPDVLAVAAALRAARGDEAQAIELYERAIARGAPPDALGALGDLHALAGRSDRAEEAWARAEAALAAHDHGGAGNLALARFLADRKRRLDVAVAEAEAAHQRLGTPASADVLAWAYHRVGRHEEARAAIRQALAGGHPSAEVLFHAGMIEAALGHPLHARQRLYAALSLNPTFDPILAREARATWQAIAARSPTP